MSRQPPRSQPASPAPSPRRSIRIQYLGFEGVDGYREFRFRVHQSGESRERRLRIANDAFQADRVRPQDGRDVCYQKLLREIALAETSASGVTTVDDVDLVTYRNGHTPVSIRHGLRPRLQQGQRVNHAVFGLGVTAGSTRTHTRVRFDRHGPKTFLTAMLEVKVLSAPRTWQTSRGGANRPCKPPAPE